MGRDLLKFPCRTQPNSLTITIRGWLSLVWRTRSLITDKSNDVSNGSADPNSICNLPEIWTKMGE